jgi:hypothetical protein
MRLRELEQLAVTEDESEFSDSVSEDADKGEQSILSAVSVQACLVLPFCFVFALLATWVQHNVVCYLI